MAIISGTTQDDIITPTEITSGVRGGYPSDAADTVTASSGNDIVDAGGGNDSVNGGTGNDELAAGTGDDTLNGSYGQDTLYGSAGNDVLDGEFDVDVIYGGDGNDQFKSSSVSGDILDGGAGYDTLLSSGFNNIRIVSFDSSSNSIEEILGRSSSQATLYGDDSDNYFNFTNTKLVNIKVDAYYGNDTILGSNISSDVIRGGSGADVIYGGSGNDILDGDYNDDRIYGGAGDDLLNGGKDNDKAYGSDGNDQITGGDGVDELRGEAGNDTVYGGYGIDTVNGGSGNDKLYGEADADTLLGGDGLDQLSGAGGNDVFDYNAATESKPGLTLRDVILDFAGVGAALGDKIDLSGVDANTAVSGDQAFTFRGSGSITAPAQVRVQASGADTLLQANTGGTTAPEMEILLKATSGIWQASDFVL